MNCIVCGLDAGAGSYGGRNVCAPCDCGVPPDVSRCRLEIAALRVEIERLRAVIASIQMLVPE